MFIPRKLFLNTRFSCKIALLLQGNSSSLLDYRQGNLPHYLICRQEPPRFIGMKIPPHCWIIWPEIPPVEVIFKVKSAPAAKGKYSQYFNFYVELKSP
jgi:hypothetical protein